MLKCENIILSGSKKIFCCSAAKVTARDALSIELTRQAHITYDEWMSAKFWILRVSLRGRVCVAYTNIVIVGRRVVDIPYNI